MHLDVTEITLNGIMQSIWEYNTTKHFRPLITLIDTKAVIACSAVEDRREKRVNRWTGFLFYLHWLLFSEW